MSVQVLVARCREAPKHYMSYFWSQRDILVPVDEIGFAQSGLQTSSCGVPHQCSWRLLPSKYLPPARHLLKGCSFVKLQLASASSSQNLIGSLHVVLGERKNSCCSLAQCWIQIGPMKVFGGWEGGGGCKLAFTPEQATYLIILKPCFGHL